MDLKLTVPEILERFKEEFAFYDFDSDIRTHKYTQQECTHIRRIFYMLVYREVRGDLKHVNSFLKIKRKKGTVLYNIEQGKIMLDIEDKEFMYFYNRALRCLDVENNKLTTQDKLNESEYQIELLKKEVVKYRKLTSRYKKELDKLNN